MYRDNQRCPVLPETARLFSKYAFYFSVAVFLYADLFPFEFDFSWPHLSLHWSQIALIPYWNAKAGLHFELEDLANIFLTMPFGFAGFLHYRDRPGIAPFCKWGILGLFLGTAAELVQLALPLHATVITDAVNNGLGAFLGAVAAAVIGQRALEFFTGTSPERRNVYLWMLIWSLAATLGPYDLSPHFLSRIGSNLQALQTHPWRSEVPGGEDWIRLAGFVLIGALAVRMAVPGRRKPTIRRPFAAASLVLLLPAVLESARLLVESDSPSLSDLGLDIFAALAGAFASLFVPQISLAFSGFMLFTAAILAAGFSPYHLSSLHSHASFHWIPFYKFCSMRTPSSFYELMLVLFSFAIWGGLLQLSFPRWKCRHITLDALIFSGAMVFAHAFLTAQGGDITFIVVAVLGAWTGAYLCSAVESARACQISSIQPIPHHPELLQSRQERQGA